MINFLICSNLLNCLRSIGTIFITKKLVKTASKSIIHKSYHFSLFWCILIVSTSYISSSSKIINNTVHASIFPFLMTIFRVTIRLWSFVTLNKIYLQNFWFKSCYFNLRYAAHSHYSLKKIPRKKHPCKGIMWKIVIFAKSKKQSFKFNKYFVVYYPALAGWFCCLVPRGKRVNESILFQSFYPFLCFS